MLTVNTSSLNSSGLIASDGSYNYYYDVNGYQTMSNNQADTVYNVWSNGNLVSTYSNYYEGPYQIFKTYLSNADSRDFGQAYLGKQSKNLIGSWMQVTHGDTLSKSYTYQFDVAGRVSQMIENDGGYQIVYQYAYY
jgi:hypothetical protein